MSVGIIKEIVNETRLFLSGVRYRDLFAELHKSRSDYLNLMEKCLTGTIYEDLPMKVLGQEKYDSKIREYGWDWPSVAHTMVGVKRLSNVRLLVESIIEKNIPGDLIETGVWRGGACIMMRAVLKAYGIIDRKVWMADSFKGLPPPDIENFPDDEGEIFHEYEELSISIEDVKKNFKKYDLLDDQLVFLEGWFKDTLPSASINKIALLRLDGDLYESTIQPLEALYDKVSVGGYVIVDDYHVVKGCKAAVNDFCSERGIYPQIQEIDGVGVYWKKQA